MKNIELLQLGENIKINLQKLKNYVGAKYSYCLARNISKINAEINHLQETIVPSNEYLEYDKARVAMCEEFAEKNEDGTMKQAPNAYGQLEYIIDTTTVEWDSAITNLKNKYQDVLEKRDQQIQAYNELLEMDSNIDFYMIDMNDVPSDIGIDAMDIVQNFIIE